jgi:hypothetical protein
MLAKPSIYYPTEHRNILYRGIVNYIARGATTFFAFGALAPHINGTLALLIHELTRELASLGFFYFLKLFLHPQNHGLA